jgi:hypothetical protein
MTELPRLGGDISGTSSINDRGVVVGLSCGDAGCRAVRWDSRGLTELNTSIASAQQWGLFTALAVRSRGQITGDGSHTGNSRAIYSRHPAGADTDRHSWSKVISGFQRASYQLKGQLGVSGGAHDR